MKNEQELLIYSLDNDLNNEETNRLKLAIESSIELQKKQVQLLQMRKKIAAFSIVEDEGFSGKILQKINLFQKKKVDFEANIISMFPKVAAACVAIFLMALSIIYMTDINLSSDNLVGIENLNLEDAYVYLEN